MELKNMNGFCELTQEEAMEIDGGYRFTCDGPNRKLSKSDTAKCAFYTASLVAAPFCPPLAAIGFATAGMMFG